MRRATNPANQYVGLKKKTYSNVIMPPQSPDLSLIENFCHILKIKIVKLECSYYWYTFILIKNYEIPQLFISVTSI